MVSTVKERSFKRMTKVEQFNKNSVRCKSEAFTEDVVTTRPTPPFSLRSPKFYWYEKAPAEISEAPAIICRRLPGGTR